MTINTFMKALYNRSLSNEMIISFICEKIKDEEYSDLDAFLSFVDPTKASIEQMKLICERLKPHEHSLPTFHFLFKELCLIKEFQANE